MFRCFLFSIPFLFTFLTAAPIERIWLTHASADSSQIVVNWETEIPSPSVVEFGPGPDLGERIAVAGAATRHHVAIPLEHRDGQVHYRVGVGEERSALHRFKNYPSDVLRVAVVGDWGFAQGKDLGAILRDDVHLLLTAGDNVPSVRQSGKVGVKAFAALVDGYPELFRSTPFLPILGNHDREIAPRGPRPPGDAVYDIEATAYREFFALPGDEWKWQFALPDFDLRFIALDLNHIQDFGTTWQTCHPWQVDSPQFRWYAGAMETATDGYVVTLMNEKQTALAGATKGAWHEHFNKGSALVTGFGYFAERAELEGGLPYFNTCLKGDGDLYRDARSRFHARVDNYLLLTLRAESPKMTVALKGLDGEVLDTVEIAKRATRQD